MEGRNKITRHFVNMQHGEGKDRLTIRLNFGKSSDWNATNAQNENVRFLNGTLEIIEESL